MLEKYAPNYKLNGLENEKPRCNKWSLYPAITIIDSACIGS